MIRSLIFTVLPLCIITLACTRSSEPPRASGARELTPPTEDPPVAAEPQLHASGAKPTAECAPAPIAPCDSTAGALSVGELVVKGTRLLGTRVRVQGPLSLLNGGCTEEACSNTCRFEVVIGSGSPDQGRSFVLNDAAIDQPSSLACSAGAGDTCPGDPAQSSEPCCPLAFQGANVIATGTLARGCEGPGCGPHTLTHAVLCTL